MNDRKALLCSMAAALHQQTTEVDIAVNLALAIEAEVDKRLKKENQTYKEEQPLTGFGLEDQWSPVETSWKALAMRNISDECDWSQEAQKELQKLIKKHTTKKRSKAS